MEENKLTQPYVALSAAKLVFSLHYMAGGMQKLNGLALQKHQMCCIPIDPKHQPWPSAERKFYFTHPQYPCQFFKLAFHGLFNVVASDGS